MIHQHDIICAISTPTGIGAIGVVRLSGKGSVALVDSCFKAASGRPLSSYTSHQAVFGQVFQNSILLDEVLVTLFLDHKSYTGEESVEVACHGSPYILQEMLYLMIGLGARMAEAGEFSRRAFLNGKLDLSQTEAVADLIHAEDKQSHAIALNQMRGGFSQRISQMRQQLLHFASMLELELDFGEEDVEFADRQELITEVTEIAKELTILHSSFKQGNVLKQGYSVAIVGAPNAGKSTLLNVLLQDHKAIVSHIAGTTRDSVEDTMYLEGVKFRFIDTAGIRETSDTIEKIGIERALNMMKKAQIVLFMFDLTTATERSVKQTLSEYENTLKTEQNVLVVLNKSDRAKQSSPFDLDYPWVAISAAQQQGIDQLQQWLVQQVKNKTTSDQTLISNARHYAAIGEALTHLKTVNQGLDQGLPSDLVASDLRFAMDALGKITGEMTSEDILSKVFSDFCIGK